jgi:hypothetical protein
METLAALAVWCLVGSEELKCKYKGKGGPTRGALRGGGGESDVPYLQALICMCLRFFGFFEKPLFGVFELHAGKFPKRR